MTAWTTLGATPATAAAADQLCGPEGGVSDSLAVTGWVHEERSYDEADLAALPQTTVADTFRSGSGTTSRNYSGVDLWRLLELPDNSGGIGTFLLPSAPSGPQDGPQHNDITRYSVVVTGSDCFQAVYAMTEISPWFGGQPVVVATAQGDYDADDLTPVTDSLGDSGFARISNPIDVRGSRRISNIVEIRVLQAPVGSSVPPANAPTCAGGVSDEFTVSGAVASPRTYDLAALQAEEQTTIAAGSANCTGVELWRLLGLSAENGGLGSYITAEAPGPQYPDPQHNDLTRFSVMVTASDCHQSLFSLAEISPFFGGHPVLVATAFGAHDPDDLTPVTDPLGANGFARIANQVDQRGTRRASNIVDIKVIAPPTPEVVWETPAAIVQGTPLSDVQLNAHAVLLDAEVPDTFTYDLPSGTVLPVGTHTLSALFVPESPSSVTIARGAVTLQVVDSPGADVPTSIASTVQRKVMTYGQSNRASAVLTAGANPLGGQQVELFERSHGSSTFTRVAAAVTDSQGRASARIKPAKRAVHEWRYAGSEGYAASRSARQAVKVRAKVTLAVRKKQTKHGVKVVAKGTVRPTRAGASVRLMKKSKAGAVAVARGTVKRNVKLKLTKSLPRGTHRLFLVVRAGEGSAKGTSPTRTVTIKRR
ncbi:hypothetical protein [Nocardioides alcanivorans]|uniref:hypothetical protein n=1 Tax=Nocardioides alcanivorans TaxID=2897352 RepID=UPI001F4478F2|nr:hypothetical protein [Nocardioides alcanivorans]